MLAGAAGIDLRVLHRQPAERHEQLGVAREVLPFGVLEDELLERRGDAAQDDAARGHAVAVHAVGIAADRAQEPVQLALRMMEAPGARPAIGAGEDRAVAVRADHAAELAGGEVERLVPGQLDEGLLAAARTRLRAVTQEAFAHCGAAHPGRGGDRARHRTAERRGVGVPRRGLERLQHAIRHDRAIDAPMGRGEGHCMSVDQICRP